MALRGNGAAYFHRDVNSLLISSGEIDYGRLAKSLNTFESDQLFRPVVIENYPSEKMDVVMKNLDHFWAAVCLDRKVTCRFSRPGETQKASKAMLVNAAVTMTGEKPQSRPWNLYQRRIEIYCKQHGLAFKPLN